MEFIALIVRYRTPGLKIKKLVHFFLKARARPLFVFTENEKLAQVCLSDALGLASGFFGPFQAFDKNIK